jgi:hypothetical protein
MKSVFLFVVLIGVYFLTQWGVMRMTKRTCRAIIKDLDGRGAYDSESAAVLPYAKRKGFFHIGARDYKPQALQYLIHREIVLTTDDGRYYLGKNAEGADL